ncbi:cupin domain-containing protein [Novosphingobium sp. SG707]|uniref:cupin domain-containing protein n=1 Tax=Novosphingobium sp. SG707 TaxID=2586996 RepID=UPI001445D228|nr:cupin domain-containing protein [Novosphingobium sp. SG707]
MRIHDDLSMRTVVHGGQMDWVPSPSPGVERRMLFRQGGEKARATSIVRYAPGSHFAAHSHPGGEEFLVLEGTFQDERGDYPAGSYVRNPPGSSHAPASAQGCIIFVRLWQFAEGDSESGVCCENAPTRQLYLAPGEWVSIENWAPGTLLDLPNPDGIELLVLSGACAAGEDLLSRWSWLRLPAGERLTGKVGDEGAQVWIRRGPLIHPHVVSFGGNP